MKTLLITSFLFLSMSAAHAGWKTEAKAILKEYKTECKTTEVFVDRIVKDDYIEGHVRGLSADAMEKMKVVFYVKTNRWYVHPFEGQEAGSSYANLDSQGGFRINTVLRDVPAKKLAVIVMPKPVFISSQHLWLNPLLGFFGGATKYKCAYTTIAGTGDFR